jgi:peptidyl-prolyl cis-trans isomerase C
MGSNAGKMRASHILVKTSTEAQAILKRLDNGEDFKKLAAELSSCPSKKRGGDLDFFTKGKMAQEFEKAVLAAKVGELINHPVKTQFGYHVIKRTG